MNTYELTQQFVVLAAMLESGEIDEEVYKDTVESLPVEDAVESFAKMRKNFKGDEDKISEEIKRLQERKASFAKAQLRCNESILTLLNLSGNKKIKTALFTVSKTTSSKLEIINQNEIPPEYMKVRAEPDKTLIKSTIKAGEDVPGCEMQKTESVTIR